MSSSRTRLSVGLRPMGRILAAIIAIPFLATALLLIGVAVAQVVKALSQESGIVVAVLLAAVIAALFLLGAAIAGWAVYALARLVRYAAWLDGSRLGVRRLVRTHWVDLGSAEVDVGEIGANARVSGRLERLQFRTVRARDHSSSGWVDVPVDPGEAMAADQLTMLADAFTIGRIRAGEDDPAFLIAGELRARAAAKAPPSIAA